MAQTGYKRFLNRRKWQTDFAQEYIEPSPYDTQLAGTHSFRFSIYLESTAQVMLFLDPAGAPQTPTPYHIFDYGNPGSEQTYDLTLGSIPSGNYNFRILVASTASFQYNARYLAGSFEPNTTTGGEGPYFEPVWDPGICAVNGSQTLEPPLLSISGGDTVTTLQWSQVLSSTAYQLQKSTDGVVWSDLVVADANTFVYYDADFIPFTTYYYRIRSIGNGTNYLDSGYAQESFSTTSKKLSASALSAAGASTTTISLTWTDVSNETEYELARSLSFDGGYTIIGTFVPGVTSFTDTGLVTNTRYFYRIVAKGDGTLYTDSDYRFANARTI
jgi:hypothetical protein